MKNRKTKLYNQSKRSKAFSSSSFFIFVVEFSVFRHLKSQQSFSSSKRHSIQHLFNIKIRSIFHSTQWNQTIITCKQGFFLSRLIESSSKLCAVFSSSWKQIISLICITGSGFYDFVGKENLQGDSWMSFWIKSLSEWILFFSFQSNLIKFNNQQKLKFVKMKFFKIYKNKILIFFQNWISENCFRMKSFSQFFLS